MSNLIPSFVSLDKGLNLQTAKLIAPPGTVMDTLNYEQVDFQGQKRIDGYTRYDGSLLATLDDYLVLTLDSVFAGATGSLVYVGPKATDLLGVVVRVDGITVYIAIINHKLVPTADDTVISEGNSYTVVSAVNGKDSGATENEHYTFLLEFTDALRNRIEQLPPVVGLHWFRDRLYAVADVVVITLSGATPIIYPNDVLSIGSSEAKVLDAFVDGTNRIVFVSTLDLDIWEQEGVTVTRDDVSVGSTAASAMSDAIVPFATFYESRSELQVLEEDGPSGPYDFGWRLKDLGWLINFEAGISLYGDLVALNQNRQGIGIQGPTNVDGSNGSALSVTQNVPISGEVAQVNGWKQLGSPTSYTITPQPITYTDDNFLYADGYISWDRDGTITQNTAVLQSRPANATVEVEIDG